MNAFTPGLDLNLALVDEIERASLWGWPPTVVDELADGWILRATPGLDRGRSCHALTPRTRGLSPGELGEALVRVRAFSAVHGIRGGLTVSPLEIHDGVVPQLAAAGWEPAGQVAVMIAERESALARSTGARGGAVPERVQYGAAEPAWLDAWQVANGSLARDTIDAHAATVFAHMGTRAVFGRLGMEASGVVVEDPDRRWAGLFSLVVAESQRRRGLGRLLIQRQLEAVSAPRVYLQVSAENAGALALYESFGFRRSHGYQHVVAPEGWADGGVGVG